MLQAAPSVAAVEEATERGVVDDLELLRSLVGALKLVRRDDLCEVEEGALGRGGRNMVDDGRVVGMHAARAMHGDAVLLPARAADNSHVDVGTVGPPNVPEHPRVAMAQNRAASTGNDGGKPLATERRGRRSHEVNAVMLSREPPLLDPLGNTGWREAEGSQGSCVNDAVALDRQMR
jgi:hypothetical protein